MSLDRDAREKLVRALADAMIQHADELTSLDQAIGDGDHGLNMKRGFAAVLAALPGLADKSMPEMLKTIGTTLVMKVGGASGPLVGTFFMELGKALPETPARSDLVAARTRRSRPSRRAAVRMLDRRRCSTSWCLCKWYLRRVATRAQSRQKLRVRPIARFPCWPFAVAHPSSASARSATWIRGRAPRLS